MFTRAREEDGFGLIELLVALIVLFVGLMAIVGVFVSGLVTIRRAAQISSAAAIADKEMEGFRALRFASIGLLTPISTNTVYTGDAAYSASQSTVATCAGDSGQCSSSQTITGPDNRSYRVDTYVVLDTNAAVASGTLKKVTIVVRNPSNVTGPPLIREVSNFDSWFG